MPFELYQGDCIEILSSMDANTIQCCVTSPPYYGLRDYGVDGQIGLESTPDEYVSKLVQVFQEVKRVLKDDGTLWLNLGDSYASLGQSAQTDEATGWKHGPLENEKRSRARGAGNGIKPKDLIGIPWMVAFALRADGWYLRSDIIWAKPNPMPESVKDRPTKSHEYMFLLSKSQKYYYDYEAILEPVTNSTVERLSQNIESQKGSDRVPGKSNGNMKAVLPTKYDDSNMGGGGTGWTHHSGYFGENGEERFYRKQDNTGNPTYTGFNDRYKENHPDGMPARNKRTVWTIKTQPFKGAHFAVMPEKLVEPCILAGSKPGDIVLDPFNGSGTVGAVAVKNGRSYTGIDLNGEYIEMARQRIFEAQQQMRLPLEMEQQYAN